MSTDVDQASRVVNLRRDWSKLPNLICYLRVLLIIPITLTALRPGAAVWWGLGSFIVAAATDKLDGIIARRNNEALMTTLGKIIDPLSDKALTLATLITVWVRQVPSLQPWIGMAIAIITVREIVVLYVKGAAPIESAAQAGRFSMGAQVVALGFLLLPPMFGAQRDIALALLAVAVGASLTSGWAYWKARQKKA